MMALRDAASRQVLLAPAAAQPGAFEVYPRRFWMLFLLSAVSAQQSWVWLTYSPIEDEVRARRSRDARWCSPAVLAGESHVRMEHCRRDAASCVGLHHLHRRRVLRSRRGASPLRRWHGCRCRRAAARRRTQVQRFSMRGTIALAAAFICVGTVLRCLSTTPPYALALAHIGQIFNALYVASLRGYRLRLSTRCLLSFAPFHASSPLLVFASAWQSGTAHGFHASKGNRMLMITTTRSRQQLRVQLSAEWFAPQHRHAATAVAVAANYAGNGDTAQHVKAAASTVLALQVWAFSSRSPSTTLRA